MTLETVMHTFETPAPIRLRVEIPKGRVRVVAEETAQTRVELIALNGDATARQWIAEAVVEQRGDEVVVLVRQPGFLLFGLGGAIEAIVHLPTASSATLSTGSGHIDTTGRLGGVRANTGSGAIRLAQTAEAHARTGSGDITVESATGSVDAKTGSGNVTVGTVGGNACIVTGSGDGSVDSYVGSAKLNTGSGNLEVGQAGDSLEAFSASGSVQVKRADHGRVRAKTISGRIDVGVAQGVAAWLDITTMSGRVNSSLEQGGPPAEGEKSVQLVIDTLSGNINVARA